MRTNTGGGPAVRVKSSDFFNKLFTIKRILQLWSLIWLYVDYNQYLLFGLILFTIILSYLEFIIKAGI